METVRSKESIDRIKALQLEIQDELCREIYALQSEIKRLKFKDSIWLKWNDAISAASQVCEAYKSEDPQTNKVAEEIQSHILLLRNLDA